MAGVSPASNEAFALSTARDGGEDVAGRLSYEIKKAGHTCPTLRTGH